MSDPEPTMLKVKLSALTEVMTRAGLDQAARGFSKMIGATLTISQPQLEWVPLAQISSLLGGPESDAVGIYLLVEGDLTGQIMLVLTYEKALELVDLMLGQEPGLTTSLGSLERSALAELGNLTGTFFLNAVAAATGLDARPSPPAVMVDMLGAILDIVATASAAQGDQVLLLKTKFINAGREVQVDFWVIPDAAAPSPADEVE